MDDAVEFDVTDETKVEGKSTVEGEKSFRLDDEMRNEENVEE